MQCVVFVGVQASGKSSFYAEHFSRTHVRINLDMLRTRNREACFVRTCIESGQKFVVDNTNPTLEDRLRYISPCREAGFSVVCYYFQSRLKDALQRNASRSDAERVPDIGVRGTYAKLVVPSMDEGFDELRYVRMRPDCGFFVEEWAHEV